MSVYSLAVIKHGSKATWEERMSQSLIEGSHGRNVRWEPGGRTPGISLQSCLQPETSLTTSDGQQRNAAGLLPGLCSLANFVIKIPGVLVHGWCYSQWVTHQLIKQPGTDMATGETISVIPQWRLSSEMTLGYVRLTVLTKTMTKVR